MKLSFKNKVLLTVSVACVFCTASAIYLSDKELLEDGEDGLVEKSKAILSRVEVGAHYIAEMKTLDGVINETLKKYPDGKITEEQKLKILKNVPIFAAFQIGKKGAEAEHYEFRIASENPRNKENTATKEELIRIEKFKSDPNLKELVEQSSDGHFMLVSRPIRIMKERDCLSCHGDPALSPWKNGKDILGYQMENLKDGDFRAVFTIVSSLDPIHRAVKASTQNIMLWGTVITLIALFISFIIIRGPVSVLLKLSKVLSKTSDEVEEMSKDIADSSEALSSGATEQAASLEETASSMEEISAMVARNAENANQSNQLVLGSQKSAENGKKVIQEMIQSIHEIDQSNNNIMNQIELSNQQLSEIVKVINDIGNKTKVINEIVFQTKLLSFNASVEAARAGEHGKGFAVVAEEVGKLAQMSGNSASEITKLLEISVIKVEEIVKNTKTKVETLMKDGKVKISNGNLIAKQCGEVLAEIVEKVDNVSHMVSQITESSKEQSKGVQEINKAMTQLNAVTQINATTSESTATSAAKLSQQSIELRKSVQSIIETLNGESNPLGKVIHKNEKKMESNNGARSNVIPLHSDRRFEDVDSLKVDHTENNSKVG